MAFDTSLMSTEGLWNRADKKLDGIFQRMRSDLERQSMGRAIAALDGPNADNAMKYIYGANPELAMHLEDQLYQRSERKRQGDFRSAAANILLSDEQSHRLTRPSPPGFEQGGGMGSAPVGQPPAQSPVNALLGQPMTAPPAAGMSAPQGLPAQPQAAAPQTPDGRHPDLVALDPHKINIIRGAELIRRINPRDDAGWQQVRASAQQAGIDLTGVPEHFDPQYTQNIVALADHLGSEDSGAITVTGQRQPQRSPDYEQAARADPEKFLTFQGNRTELTKKRLEVAKSVNDLSMQLLGGVHDQASYDAAKAQAAQIYADHDQDFSQVQLPDEYSPELIHDLQMKGMNTSQQIHAIATENRLSLDQADDQADNERADRIAESQDRYRRGRLKQMGQPRPRSPAPAKAPPAPTPNTVIGRIMDKEARGETLKPGEQKVIDQYRAGKRRGAGGGGASAVPTKIRPNEPVSKLADGRLAVVRNGQWVPAER